MGLFGYKDLSVEGITEDEFKKYKKGLEMLTTADSIKKTAKVCGISQDAVYTIRMHYRELLDLERTREEVGI